jgi:hypothetical protein
MEINEELLLEEKEDFIVESENKRTGKCIKICGSEFGNNNISFKLGTISNKERPETIFIEVSFWIDFKDKTNISQYDDKFYFIDYDYELNKKLSKNLKDIYKKDLKNILENNYYFPYYLDNIYIFNFPEKINYNNKRSFVTIELDLHTINNDLTENYYSINSKKDNELFLEVKKICNIISNCDLLKEKLDFTIHKKK